MVIIVNDVSYRFSFLQPQNTKMPEPASKEMIEVVEKMMEGGGENLDACELVKREKPH